MRRPVVWLAAGMAIGVTAMLALPSGAAGSVAATNTPDRITLTYSDMKPGTSHTFSMPGNLARVEVAASFPSPPAQFPASNVMSALVSYEPETHRLTWVGTNSNGTRSLSRQGQKVIAEICGSTCGFVIAKLWITTGPDQMTLTLSKSAGTNANFTVNLWH